MNCWIWEGQCLETEPEGYYGFIYLIKFHGKHLTAKQKKELEYPLGSIYVGKKCFTHKTKSKLSKKAKLKPENKGKRIIRSTKNSGWMEYYGSSLNLKAFIAKCGKENFSREVLCLCTSKSELTYQEVVKQIEYRVLEVDSFNAWISAKVWRSHLQSKK